MNKTFWWILILSVLLKIVISLSTFHPDIRHFDLAGLVVSSGNILNLYDFANSYGSELAILNQSNRFNYPPAIYLISGLFSLIFTPIVGQSIVIQFLKDTFGVLGSFQLSLHLLLLKLPYLAFDLAVGFILMRLFAGTKEKLLAYGFWMFNPVNIYTTYMIGQFDIIPVFFVCLSLLFAKLAQPFRAALSLGFGIAFKIFPLFLLLPLAISQKSWVSRFWIIILGFLPYFVFILPYIWSTGFRNQALFASQTDKGFYAQILVSGGESIFLFPATLIFLLYIFFFKGIKMDSIWQKFMLILFLFFIFTHFHAQWFLWLTPFLIIDLIYSKFRHWILVLALVLCWFASLFFFDPSLTVGLFSPVWPALFNQPSLWEILNITVDFNFARSIIQTVFTGSAIYYLYKYFPQTNE